MSPRPTISRRPRFTITFCCEDPAWRRLLPGAKGLLCRASRQAFATAWKEGWRGSSIGHECAIVLTDDEKMKALNKNWRGLNKTTDVLSFAFLDSWKEHNRKSSKGSDRPSPSASWELGDVFLASGTIMRAAKKRGKSVAAHATHLAIHGTLHLLGYDHLLRKDALIMEALEKSAMKTLGFADPYRETR